MKLMIVSLRDQKAGAFTPPSFFPSEGVAIRAFTEGVNTQGERDLYKHPDDFELFHIGFFDDSDVLLEAVKPRSLALGSMVKVR